MCWVLTASVRPAEPSTAKPIGRNRGMTRLTEKNVSKNPQTAEPVVPTTPNVRPEPPDNEARWCRKNDIQTRRHASAGLSKPSRAT